MPRKRNLVLLHVVCKATGRQPGTIINWATKGCLSLGRVIHSEPDQNHAKPSLYDLDDAIKGKNAFYEPRDELVVKWVPCTYIAPPLRSVESVSRRCGWSSSPSPERGRSSGRKLRRLARRLHPEKPRRQV